MSKYPTSPMTGKPEWRPPKPVQPTRSEGGMHYDYREDHPAYATIAASRVSGSGTHLFDSDFRHQHHVEVTIRKADVSRSNISTEHIMGHADLITVKLSEAQWATFVATPNVGTGVPCTLHHVGRKPIIEALESADAIGYVPPIQPIADAPSKARADLDLRLAEALATLDEVKRAIQPSSGTIGIGARRELASKLERVERALSTGPNNGIGWITRQFDEHTEQTIEKAKIEVAAYMTAAVNRAGLAALGASPPFEIGPGDSLDPDDPDSVAFGSVGSDSAPDPY